MSILWNKITNILLAIEDDDNVTSIVKKVNCTYAWGLKSLNKLYEMGLVTFERRGRVKNVFITKKGKEIVKKLLEIKELEV